MKMLGTYSKFAHKAKIGSVFTLTSICLSQNMYSFEVGVGAKVDLQTQRANTQFNVKACQPI